MYRSSYDTDICFSPNGRLFQVEYAQEAEKQGSAVVGVRTSKYAILAGLRRQASTLATPQQKLFEVDRHIALAPSGLNADARVLLKHLQTECLNHRYVFDGPMPVGRLVAQLADKCQYFTQHEESRPYGVGLLLIGVDKTGPHLYHNLASGNAFEYKAHAIGARSQGARTYLEKVFSNFEDLEQDDLIKHALTALKAASPVPLSARNVSIAVVGVGQDLRILDSDDVRPYVTLVTDEVAATSAEQTAKAEQEHKEAPAAEEDVQMS